MDVSRYGCMYVCMYVRIFAVAGVLTAASLQISSQTLGADIEVDTLTRAAATGLGTAGKEESLL